MTDAFPFVPVEERLASRRADVMAYLREHPGCTAREVAVNVIGGTGATRTSSRAYAYTTLVELERRGLVVRDRSENTHTWATKAEDRSEQKEGP